MLKKLANYNQAIDRLGHQGTAYCLAAACGWSAEQRQVLYEKMVAGMRELREQYAALPWWLRVFATKPPVPGDAT